jgi:hypothetical protein
MDEVAREVTVSTARYYMMRLGGQDSPGLSQPRYPRKLASEAELLTLRPELNHIE